MAEQIRATKTAPPAATAHLARDKRQRSGLAARAVIADGSRLIPLPAEHPMLLATEKADQPARDLSEIRVHHEQAAEHAPLKPSGDRPMHARASRSAAGSAQSKVANSATQVSPRAVAAPVSLPLGRSVDEFEFQADRVADRVMQRRDGPADDGQPHVEARAGAASMPMRPISATLPDAANVQPHVRGVLSTAGEPLDRSTRAFMEPRFGHDFSRIRIHADWQAQQSARRLNAQAYAAGHHIAFAPRRYAPGSYEGRWLLAHELAHVVQQAGHGADAVQRKGDVSRHDWTVVTGSSDPPVVLPRSTQLEMALDRLSEPAMERIPGVETLKMKLRADLNALAGPDESADRQRADRLLKMLVATEGVFPALAQMLKPENYLASLQQRLTGEVAEIRQAYVAALFGAYSKADVDEQVLAIAEERMQRFPSYVVQQYLGKDGIESMISALGDLSAQVSQLRHLSGHGPRKLDSIVHLSPHSPEQAESDMRQELAKTRAAQSGDVSNAMQAVQDLTEKVQLGTSAMTALALYEQFYLWRHQVDDTALVLFLSDQPYHAARRAEIKLEGIVSYFESSTWHFADPEDAKYIAEQGMMDLGDYVRSKEFDQAIELVKDRLETIATINVIATVAVITAAAALSAGAAAALVAPTLELAGAGTAAIGLGTLAAESFAFTLASRAGQQIAFGKTEGSFLADWGMNFLMFGVLKGADTAFDKAFRLAPEAGTAAKAAYGLGKTATSLIALQGFAEGEHLISKGRLMSGDERTRSVVQNVVLTLMLSAGRFITAPLEARITAAIAGKMRPVFQAQMKGLADERLTLKADLDALGRYEDVDPAHVAAVLGRIEQLWAKELTLLSNGAKRKILTVAELDAATASYSAKIVELDLQLARLNTNVRVGAGKQMFRPLQSGVVAYTEGGAQALRDFYTARHGKLEESKNFKNVLEGRVAGELTYYVPENAAGTFLKIGEAAKVAGVRDRALREAAGDPVVRQGLDNLNKLFGPLKGDDILAAAAPEDLGNLLRSLADPDVPRFQNSGYYRELARRPPAIEFAQQYGAKTLRNLALRYGWTDALISDILPRATSKIDSLPVTDRPALLDSLRTESDRARLDALIGKQKAPPKPRPVKPTKANMGVDRGVKAWSRFYANEAAGAIKRKELNPDQTTLAKRADVLQILDRAKQGVFKDLSHESRVALIDRFDALGISAGMGRGRVNALRGSLSEVLLRPDPFEAKHAFKGGQEVPLGAAGSGATIPDYSLRHPGSIEWVNQKSDWIDKDSQNKADVFARGVTAANAYRDAARIEGANVPAGDRYSLDFIRDPGDATRRAMLKILFTEPLIFRVKFGTGWYDRSILRGAPALVQVGTVP
jgi:Domain of unknown function (DUF4157)